MPATQPPQPTASTSTQPVSHASILELNAITAELEGRIGREGARQVRAAHTRQRALVKAKDPFGRPSPGLVKRLAAQARTDAKRRHFADDADMSEQQRREIMEAKARRYDALSRGDFSGMSEKELAEAAVDFERKADAWSDHSSDVDESAAPGPEQDDLEQVEYVDELGRTRVGTRREAREAERAARQGQVGDRQDRGRSQPAQEDNAAASSSYAQVKQSNVIYGEQAFFPVYEPDPDALRRKHQEAEAEARAHHYDASKEVRNRGAGAYQFSLDDNVRAEQQAALKASRLETEAARADAAARPASKAQLARQKLLDDRRALVERKRRQLMGDGAVDDAKRRRAERDADAFLRGVEGEMGGGGSA